MPIVVNTNTMSLNAQRHLNNNTNALAKSMEKLSSGYRINRSSDDAAGLQISETLRGQIRGTKKALENSQTGINVLNIADGALEVVTDNLQRIRELTVQAADDSNDTAQRTAIAQEIDARRSDINRIVAATQFNGKVLLNGTSTQFDVQVGANGTANDEIAIASSFASATTTSLGLTAATVSTNALAQTYLTAVDAALSTLNTQRATIGSYVNRLESAAANLMNGLENLSSAESQIRNVDVASESANMARNQILQQAASSILSQANAAPQLALRLLQ